MTKTTDEIDGLAREVFGGSFPADVSAQAKEVARRVPLAEELAGLAFKDKNKTAWTHVQEGLFHLPIYKVTSGIKNTDRRYPFFRGDLVSFGIRDAIWAVEEKLLPRITSDERASGERAGEIVEAEFRKRSVMNHPYFKFIAEGDFSPEQERAAVLAYLHSVMVRIRTVHRAIMLVQIPMEFHDTIKIAKLVVDELGEGELAKAHAQRTALDIEKWGDTVDWHAPVDSVEMKAMLNWNLRTVTHPDMLWAFCGIFCVEWNSYLELRAALLALRERGISDQKMEVLVQHGDGDPYDQDQHALLVRQELGRRIETPEDLDTMMTGVNYHQGLYHGFFEGEFAKLKAAVAAA